MEGDEGMITAGIDIGHESVNVAIMDDDVLAQARRGHTRTDTLTAGTLLKEAGIQTGMQMMVGALSSEAGKRVILEDTPSSLRILIFRGRKTVLSA